MRKHKDSLSKTSLKRNHTVAKDISKNYNTLPDGWRRKEIKYAGIC
jgi:hypothetical protein